MPSAMAHFVRLLCGPICNGTGAMHSSVEQLCAALTEYWVPVLPRPVPNGAQASFVAHFNELPLVTDWSWPRGRLRDLALWVA